MLKLKYYGNALPYGKAQHVPFADAPYDKALKSLISMS